MKFRPFTPGGGLGGGPGGVGGPAGGGAGGGTGGSSGPRPKIPPSAIPDSAIPVPQSNSALDDCEEECDRDWDRDKVAICDADAAMRGYNPKRYKQCMDRLNEILILCYQHCAETCR